MLIKSATYVKSSVTEEQCPKPDKAEFAFIGRSNVGKSSLINMLTGNKGLAKTSGKPGKTRHINHFLINESWYLVDMPGYGYAKVSQKEREIWFEKSIEYFMNRKNLITTFVLVDSRIPPQKIDIDLINKLGNSGLPFCIIYTKCDQVKNNKLAKNKQLFDKELLETWEELPKHINSSASTAVGKEEILEYIEELIPLFTKA
ncbi:MAG: YihA family ribosome biogenesis GTP-binding protein [Bacteroidia bacterium]|nr:YihA family ribosome biogenesis GTP-binding protein [Bacteroidia bacterium]